MSEVKDARFHTLKKPVMLNLMCPTDREGGLMKTYGDGKIAGCTACSGKWDQDKLVEWNLRHLMALMITKWEPVEKTPAWEWKTKMEALRQERVAKEREAKAGGPAFELAAAQMRNRAEG